MIQQFSSLFTSKKSLFSNEQKNLTLDIEDEYENICYDNGMVSPPLSRNNSFSISSALSPLARSISITSLSRNNSFVGSLFPTSSTSRPTSSRFNFNLFDTESNPTPISRVPSLDFLPSRLKRALSIPREPDNFSRSSENESTSSRLTNDFQLIELIGLGSFGTVYKAQGKLDGVMYAIKKSDRKFITIEEKSIIPHEVHILATLSDGDVTNGIVRYYNSWYEEDYLCIQMELCDSSVNDLNEPLSTPLCYCMLREILNALEFLHRNEFVHLDIKPENILRKKDHFKLGGFGLAVQMTRREGRSSNETEIIDTRYMAGELLSNEPISDVSKCDIFSLGLTAYALATNSLPPPNGILWCQLRNGLLPHLNEINLLDLITMMTLLDPTQRPSALFCIQNYSILMSRDEILLKEQLAKIHYLESQLQLLSNTTSSVTAP